MLAYFLQDSVIAWLCLSKIVLNVVIASHCDFIR